MLDQLGLDSTDQRVYAELVAGGDVTVETLEDRLGLTGAAVRQSLGRLEELGLVQLPGSGPLCATPVDPNVGLAALLARKQAEAAERQAQLEQSRLAVESWLQVYAAPAAAGNLPDVTRLSGVDAVRAKLEELSSTCTEEVWSLNPGGAQSAASLARARPLNVATLERGVRIRTVYLDSVRNDDATVEHARWMSQLGAEVRTVPVLPLRMVLVDRRTALVPLDQDDSTKGALLVSGSGLVCGLVALFLTTWRDALPLGNHRPARLPGQPTPQEWHALVLWAQGHTDAAVARRLGVSERTVRRINDSLAARSGSRSRLELGARAMALGWLSVEDLDGTAHVTSA